MPNHLTKALEYARRKFETNYPDLCNLPENGQSVWLENSYIDDIKSFLSSSHLAILDAMETEIKYMKKRDNVNKWGGQYGHPETDFNIGYNTALKNILALIANAKKI